MGCCEARNGEDKTLNLQMKKMFSQNTANNFVTRDKSEIKTQNAQLEVLKNSKKNHIDIPITKEVRIPTIEISNDIIKTKKRLYLRIFESKFISEGTILTINPGGLEGSERMAKDGVVLFGTKNDDIANDFNFPEDDLIGKNHFEIRYDLTKDGYKIKNLCGSGLFIKINKPTLLRNNSIFCFSNTHIYVKITMDSRYLNMDTQATEGDTINSIISLKVIHGINENQEFTFQSKKKSIIKVGRLSTQGMDVCFPDESTSRLQSTIYYEHNNWNIVDGDGSKISLNGTWSLADDFVDINEAMIFRAGTTSFESHLQDPIFSH